MLNQTVSEKPNFAICPWRCLELGEEKLKTTVNKGKNLRVNCRGGKAMSHMRCYITEKKAKTFSRQLLFFHFKIH